MKESHLISKYKRLMDEFIENSAALQRKFEEDKTHFKNELLREFGLCVGDEVVLEIIEYRDDRVHCFSAAQRATCYFGDLRILSSSYNEPFFGAVLYTKTKQGKLRKTPVIHNEFCAWKLWKNGELVLSHLPSSIIIPGTYTEKELERMRTVMAEHQKIS